jgi:hypothetical protein
MLVKIRVTRPTYWALLWKVKTLRKLSTSVTKKMSVTINWKTSTIPYSCIPHLPDLISLDPIISDHCLFSFLFTLISFYVYLFIVMKRVIVVPDHTQRHKHTHTLSRIPLDGESARCSDLYMIIHNIHARGGIRTRNPIKREAANLHLRPCGHLARQYCCSCLHVFRHCSKIAYG